MAGAVGDISSEPRSRTFALQTKSLAFSKCRDSERSLFWGFDCGDGWFDILNHAFSLVSGRTDISPGCGEVTVVEVKEKFGGLRIHYRGGDDFVEGVFNLAESASVHICTICGNRAPNRGLHYHHPRCETHYGN
ncbi:hypothetical protein HBN71_21495 [Pseudomonas lundensis]|uniref:hypothetical protein n=1 Tax=Pseudomonas TaxID=286 RepID=UPI0011118E93|nr:MULTISPECIES: hypothetical protein [Pseudomonas]NNA13720.1 hypothetical protein [Pseudomonas lundensis]